LRRFQPTLISLMLLLALVSLWSVPVSADVPIHTLSTTTSGADTVLVITVTHQDPTTSHRIDLIEVEVTNSTGTDTYMVSPPPGLQPVTFTVTFDLGPITELNTIRSRVHCNVHGWSVVETLTLNPQAVVPSSPRDLQVRAGDGQASLTWQVPADDGGSSVTNYVVYRGSSSGNESLLTTLGNVRNYVDTGLNNNETYFYKVSAMNAAGESALSEEVSVIPNLAAPDGMGQTLLIVAGIIVVVIIISAVYLIQTRRK